MKKISAPLKDAAITVSLLFLCFILCLLIQNAFGAYTDPRRLYPGLFPYLAYHGWLYLRFCIGYSECVHF